MKKIYNGNYTSLSNEIIRDKEVKLKEKGLFLLLWSLPEEWNFSIKGLSKIVLDGESSIKNSLKQLEKKGYLQRKYYYNSKGHKKSEYFLFDEPRVENPTKENPTKENPTKENQPNNKRKNLLNKELIKEIDNKKFFENDEINNLFLEFLETRPKKKNEPKKIERLVNKLNKFKDNEIKEAIENTLAFGWQGIFPKSNSKSYNQDYEAPKWEEQEKPKQDEKKLEEIKKLMGDK